MGNPVLYYAEWILEHGSEEDIYVLKGSRIKKLLTIKLRRMREAGHLVGSEEGGGNKHLQEDQ